MALFCYGIKVLKNIEVIHTWRADLLGLICFHLRSIDELQKVARGEWLFSNYKLEVIEKVLPAKASKPGRLAVGPRTTGDMPVIIPDDLIGVQAYVIWEQSGRPQVWLIGVWV